MAGPQELKDVEAGEGQPLLADTFFEKSPRENDADEYKSPHLREVFAWKVRSAAPARERDVGEP